MISSTLGDIYGRKYYHNFIREGECYWFGFAQGEGPTEDMNENQWNEYRIKHPKRIKGMVVYFKIQVTYIRAGVVFYNLPDFPQANERYFSDHSIMAERIRPAKINLDEVREHWLKTNDYDIFGDNRLGFSKEDNYNFDTLDGVIEIEVI